MDYTLPAGFNNLTYDQSVEALIKWCNYVDKGRYLYLVAFQLKNQIKLMYASAMDPVRASILVALHSKLYSTKVLEYFKKLNTDNGHKLCELMFKEYMVKTQNVANIEVVPQSLPTSSE